MPGKVDIFVRVPGFSASTAGQTFCCCARSMLDFTITWALRRLNRRGGCRIRYQYSRTGFWNRSSFTLTRDDAGLLVSATFH